MKLPTSYFTSISRYINPKYIDGMVNDLPGVLDKYEINTKLRICHFLAQTCHESDSFKTFQEYASGKAYQGRKDLGNVNPGDGVKYKGRGALQITGRYNYKKYGDKMGLDLISKPQLLEIPKYAFESAAIYWNDHKLNDYADKNDILTITKRINGGTNGLDDRKAKFALAIKNWKDEFLKG